MVNQGKRDFLNIFTRHHIGVTEHDYRCFRGEPVHQLVADVRTVAKFVCRSPDQFFCFFRTVGIAVVQYLGNRGDGQVAHAGQMPQRHPLLLSVIHDRNPFFEITWFIDTNMFALLIIQHFLPFVNRLFS